MILVAAAILFINLFFGYWRTNVRKFSPQWFLAVHIPVPIVIALRILSGLGWRLISFPLFVTAFFLGQLLGGRIRSFFLQHNHPDLSSFLFMDLIRLGRR